MNPQTGTVEIEFEGETYRLRFTTNAMVTMEDEFDMGIAQIAQSFKNPEFVSFKNIRRIFRCGLLAHHPDITAAEAGNIMDAAGNFQAITEIVMDAFMAAFGADDDAGNAKGASRPKG